MRWRGDSVSPADGHSGSQKPHSMHLSTSASAAGSGFRWRRCASRSSVISTPGLRSPCGSKSALIARISPAPAELEEGRYVASGAVLRLQRAVVALDDEPRHRVHEAAVALDLGRRAEVL